jgi:Flp pilus assembly protein CpaB
MTYRLRNIFIAIALALIAALLTIFYVTNYKRNVQQSEANVRVYVAAQDIPAGLVGSDVVANHLLQAREVARRTVVPGAISDPDQVAKLVATEPIYAGEQVTLRRFGSPTAEGVQGQITGTMRAIQIPGDSNQLLTGTLRSGDRVDIVANIDAPSGRLTKIVLRNIQVISPSGTPTAGQRIASTPGAVLLAIRDTQVQKLFFVVKNTQWTFELRPALKAPDSPDRTANLNTVLNGR